MLKDELKKLQYGDDGSADEPAVINKAYGYCRISHKKAFSEGDGIKAQRRRITQYHEMHLKDDGIPLEDVIEEPEAVSAFTTPFHQRPAGRDLFDRLQPGDHMIVDKIDRLWRSVTDFAKLMELFHNMNVSVHFVSILGGSIQSNSQLGDFTLKLMVLIAELESKQISERTKAGLDYSSKKNGSWIRTVNTPPRGCKSVKGMVNGRTRLVPIWDPKEKSFMEAIVAIKERDGGFHDWQDCYQAIENLAAKLEGRQPIPFHRHPEKLRKKWRRLYSHEVAYRYLEIQDPRQIPCKEIVQAASRQYYNDKCMEMWQKDPTWKPPNRHWNPNLQRLTKGELLKLAEESA